MTELEASLSAAFQMLLAQYASDAIASSERISALSTQVADLSLQLQAQAQGTSTLSMQVSSLTQQLQQQTLDTSALSQQVTRLITLLNDLSGSDLDALLGE